MAFLNGYAGSSFVALLKSHYQELMPRFEGAAPGVDIVHGTTICSLRYAGGVVIGGDRRATADGHIVMSEDVTKVYKVDDHSAIAIAGAFGPSVKMARLFQVELEHYEKMEGVALTLDGKANKLSQMIEMNFPAAIQGLIVMPLYAGYDLHDGFGKIFEYDVTGGVFARSNAEPYAASGSGGDRARTTFEHFYKEGMTRDESVELLKKALEFAARKDTATGGVHTVIMAIEEHGVYEVPTGD